MNLLDLRLQAFFERLAGPEAPGGGSCAAVTVLAGVSLLEKAAKLGALNGEPLARVHAALETLLLRDAEVLAEVLPLLREIGPDGNSGAWNEALTRATEVPLDIADGAAAALRWATDAAKRAPLPLVCDIKCAALSCHAGAQSAVLLAELNVSLLRDDESLARRLRQRAAEAAETTGVLLDNILVV